MVPSFRYKYKSCHDCFMTRDEYNLTRDGLNRSLTYKPKWLGRTNKY